MTMKPGDFIKIWYEDSVDTEYNIPPFYGVHIETTEYDDYCGDVKRKSHCIYVMNKFRSYWAEDWNFEIINEARCATLRSEFQHTSSE